MNRLHLTALAASSVFFVAPAAAQPAAQTVQLWNYGIGPRPLTLAAGQPVTLTFVNRSGGSHDFTAAEFFAASQITAGSAPHGSVDLRGHESKTITLVPRAGTYTAHCSHFMHGALGMHDQIVVK